MPLNISRAHIGRAIATVERYRNSHRRLMEKAERTTMEMVGTAESVVSAFGFGIVQGRFAAQGGLHVVGIPAELMAGGVLIGAAALGLAGRASPHLFRFGSGALDAYATTTGFAVGKKMATQSNVAGDAALTSAEYRALRQGRPIAATSARNAAGAKR